MDLWIRSQDRTTLLKVNELVIEEDSYACNSYYFIKNYTTDTGTKIGKYKSLTRALKVLDEIEMFCNKSEDYPSNVYQMPEE